MDDYILIASHKRLNNLMLDACTTVNVNFVETILKTRPFSVDTNHLRQCLVNLLDQRHHNKDRRYIFDLIIKSERGYELVNGGTSDDDVPDATRLTRWMFIKLQMLPPKHWQDAVKVLLDKLGRDSEIIDEEFVRASMIFLMKFRK